jgi:asparagine synthase (glutamine-hydrolysing)
MCGIVTIYSPNKRVDEDILKRATLSLKHRGPDAQNWKFYEHETLGIGHTRLSLVDLSSNANQPLEIGDYVISFNGEIYNYLSLRKELQQAGFIFKTSSDTEVIIHAIQHWELELALSKFNGCFAFVLYNKKDKTLRVVRDPLGEKQLVYTITKQGDWIFASEIKALLTHPNVPKEPNLDRFTEELIFNMYADPDKTFFKDIQYVPAGSYFTFNLNTATLPIHKKYWDIHQKILPKYTQKDLDNIIDEVYSLLDDSVRLRLQADCSVGTILSGGLDSSFISVIAAGHTSLEAFTAYYDQKQNRDLTNARIVTQHNQAIKLNEILVDNNHTSEEILQLTAVIEEPLIDKVGISMNSLYRSVKEHNLKTVLNGQGSDEQWLGYLFADQIFGLPKNTYTRQNFATYWYDSSYFTDHILDTQQIKRTKEIIYHNLEKTFFAYECKNHLDTLVRFGLKTHLSSIFRMEDKYAMNNSVEVRLPYTDLRLVKLALSIPSKLKLHDKREKYILRTAGEKILPSSITKRKKQGFPHPPANYDSKIEKILVNSNNRRHKIVDEIFKNTNRTNFEQKLPIRERWILKAIDLMEELYF